MAKINEQQLGHDILTSLNDCARFLAKKYFPKEPLTIPNELAFHASLKVMIREIIKNFKTQDKITAITISFEKACEEFKINYPMADELSLNYLTECLIEGLNVFAKFFQDYEEGKYNG